MQEKENIEIDDLNALAKFFDDLARFDADDKRKELAAEAASQPIESAAPDANRQE